MELHKVWAQPEIFLLGYNSCHNRLEFKYWKDQATLNKESDTNWNHVQNFKISVISELEKSIYCVGFLFHKQIHNVLWSNTSLCSLISDF